MSETRPETGLWRVLEGPPEPPGDTVHVWRVDLGSPPAETALEALSADERERAARLRISAVRTRFERSRVALRQILASYTNADPRDLDFDYGPVGKPRLRTEAGAAAEAGLRFNLSHSGDVALCAVSGDVDVGVDVEAIRPLDDAARLAERHFSPGELQMWSAESEAGALDAFFRVWTRKEAMLKTAGLGLSRPLDRVDTEAADLDGQTYWLRDLDVGPGYTGAVARTNEPSGLDLLTWTSM